MDFSQELKSLLEISEDVFSNMSDGTSTTDSRFSKTFSNHDLEKQRNERIPKKTKQNNMFSMNVWRAYICVFSRDTGCCNEGVNG